jgi:hypothetical protein
MFDVIQIVGSLLILGGFVAALLGRLDQPGYTYLLAKLSGRRS